MTDLSPEEQARRIGLLQEAIAASGLSNRQYAEQVLVRDERTIRRWLAGVNPIPAMVVKFIEAEAGREGMEEEGARREAVKRWGECGWAQKSLEGVYEVWGGSDLEYYGSGDSWKAAFADADAKAASK